MRISDWSSDVCSSDLAETVLNAVKGDEHKQVLAGARAQLTFLRQANDLPEVATLKSRLAQNGEDDEAAYQLAIQQLRSEERRVGKESVSKGRSRRWTYH